MSGSCVCALYFFVFAESSEMSKTCFQQTERIRIEQNIPVFPVNADSRPFENPSLYKCCLIKLLVLIK